MEYKAGTLGRKFNILLETGEDILTVVRDIITKENVKNGIIVSGLGGFNYYTLNFPTLNQGEHISKSWEDTVLQLSSLQGSIDSGNIKISSCVSVDGTAPLTYAGLIDSGCKKFFYCQLMLIEILY